MQDTIGIILAAGEGTRMGNSCPKVLHEVGGEPMIFYPIQSLKELGISNIFIVVGYGEEKVKTECSSKDVEFITQEELLGTADAFKNVIESIDIKEETNIVLLYGDFPLIRPEDLKAQLGLHNEEGADCTIATSRIAGREEAFRDYGKVLRDKNGKILEIKEKDQLSSPDSHSEINLGIYCFNYSPELQEVIEEIEPSKKGEFYLTAAIKSLRKRELEVSSYEFENPCKFVGVNTQEDVAEANKVMNKRKIKELMAQGITIIAPESTFIHEKVEIQQGSVIYPNAIIENGVKIGKNCKIGPNCRLRDGTTLEEGVKIGNFAEIVRSHINKNVNIKHFSYIGDAVIGKGVNIGAGTVTANYNGKHKNRTIIEKNSFIGSGTILVAPVKVGEGATTGAGSVLPKGKDVAPGETVIGIPARRLSK